MTVFLERVILVVLAGLMLLLLGSNPMHFSWPQRLVGVVAVLGLAGLVSWAINSLNRKKTPSIPTSSKISEVTADRIFVSLGPQELSEIYKGRTEIQAKKLAAAYVGKWIKISGTVKDVSTFIPNESVSVILREDGYGENNPLFLVLLIFSNTPWLEHLEILPHGHHIVANGQIGEFSAHKLRIENCELVETTGD